MRKLALVLGLMVAFGVSADTPKNAKLVDDSVRIAKSFCGDNKECVNIIALELDGSYRDGVKAGSDDKAWNVLVNRKARQLNDLCDKAPNVNLCLSYRDQLLLRYIAGLSTQ